VEIQMGKVPKPAVEPAAVDDDDPMWREYKHRAAARARAAQLTPDYHIRKLVEVAPTLTDEQRATLAALLRPA
jgi:hypothetical protein